MHRLHVSIYTFSTRFDLNTVSVLILSLPFISYSYVKEKFYCFKNIYETWYFIFFNTFEIKTLQFLTRVHDLILLSWSLMKGVLTKQLLNSNFYVTLKF